MLQNIPVPATFVETGAYKGNGIHDLLQESRFSTIHSIELSSKWVEHCKARFQDQPRVHIHEGDSATVLERMIEDNILPTTLVLFYLDAHYSGGETAGDATDNGCPVLRELIAISKRNVPGDILFIDDMRLMGKASWSGMAGSEYPVTFFDFSHVTVDAIEKALLPRKIVKKSMCRGFDRMLIVLE
jgi:hypothetical protein